MPEAVVIMLSVRFAVPPLNCSPQELALVSALQFQLVANVKELPVTSHKLSV